MLLYQVYAICVRVRRRDSGNEGVGNRRLFLFFQRLSLYLLKRGLFHYMLMHFARRL